MIIVLFGQPSSGKTTLAKQILKSKDYHHIDGDELRDLFANYDYTKQGRIKNLNRASDIAHYLSQFKPVILSLVYPYKEARDYLNILHKDKVFWIHLTSSQNRGKDNFKVVDFDKPIDAIEINTDEPIQDCIFRILQEIP